MRLVFCGTPEFAVGTLEAVIAVGHEVALAVTQPDRAAGRGMEMHASAVKQAAAANPRFAKYLSRFRRFDGPNIDICSFCKSEPMEMVIKPIGASYPPSNTAGPRKKLAYGRSFANVKKEIIPCCHATNPYSQRGGPSRAIHP